MSFINRKYKDSVFTDLFGSDRDGKKNFLELYNGLSGSDYRLEEVTLERKIIEQSLYKTYNNDVSWEIDGKLIVLVEHQSTINENMPFRCLEYVTRIYEGIFPQKKRYAENVFKIPNPDFYVRIVSAHVYFIIYILHIKFILISLKYVHIKLFRGTGKMSRKVYSFGDKE